MTIVPIDSRRPDWFAAYTYSRHEKNVCRLLQFKGVEAFLPVYNATHRWNGRRAEVELPLFPGYLFVRIPLVERIRVLEVPGVAHLVSSKGTPVPLSEADIDHVRQCICARLRAEPFPYIQPGNRVRVTSGPLEGLEGVVVRQNGHTRFIVSIDLIMRSIAINADGCELELVSTASAAQLAA